MMKSFAVIKDGVVENCIVAESQAIAEEVTGLTCVEYFPVLPGWKYADNKFIQPEESEIVFIQPEESEIVLDNTIISVEE